MFISCMPIGAIVANQAYARRRREENERKRIKEEEKKRQEERQFPFKNKVLNGKQIEIFPYYAYKIIEEYKIEDDGQINILEIIRKPKEIICDYKVSNIDNYENISLEKYLKKI